MKVIEKSTINFKNVESIEIKNNLYGQTSENIEIRELTSNQVKNMIDKWNNSKSKGPCKFGLQYWLFITMKDGTKRTFRVNGENIKENNDWCYSIGDEQFIKRLFDNANPISSEKEIIFNLIQGHWIHDQDSLASVTIINYKWTFNYKGERTNSDDYYSISITNKLPEFVNETEKADFLILMSKTDTLNYEILGLTDSTLSMRYFPIGKIHLYKR
ncbi:MAG: hypothetical protein K0B10_03440 [Vicingaceae bacterium]|nr:hypothetical protein [Vicingaceae bacterium]